MTFQDKSSNAHVSELVAVVVPLSNRQELTSEEQISYKHLVHFLADYDKYIVVPDGLDVKFSGFGIKRFDLKFFGSLAAHTRLMLSEEFYQRFCNYKFILIYHLDSLVFSDELKKWCDMNYDYIAAPWIKHSDAPYAGNPGYEGKVGSGGFSLRKVSSFLKVINSEVPRYPYWGRLDLLKDSIANRSKWQTFIMRIAKVLGLFNNARSEMSRYSKNEEHFWTNRGKHYYPAFNIAPENVALEFAFECVPRYCFEMNNYSLSFGCHAWHKYDREFWEPYLLE
jgi:hypothetical protein